MLEFCLGVITASLLSLFLPIVPPFFSIFLLLPVLLCFMRLAILRRYIKGLYYLLGSVCFVACLSWHYQQYQTATEALLTSTVSQLTVSITEPPQVYPDYTQLNATILSGPAAGYNLTLRWAQPPALATGQQWRVGVLVKPVHGHANPAGVNAKVAALMSQRVAVGQVTPGPHVLLGHEVSLRQKLVERIEYAVRPLVTAPLLTALAVLLFASNKCCCYCWRWLSP